MVDGLSHSVDQSDLIIPGGDIHSEVEFSAAGVGVDADIIINGQVIVEADDLAIGEFTVDVDRFHAIVVRTCVELRIGGLVVAAAGGVNLGEGLELSAVGGLFHFISIYIMLIRDVPIQIRPSVADGSGEGSEGDGEGDIIPCSKIAEACCVEGDGVVSGIYLSSV